MIHDHMNLLLLHPGVGGFSNLPTLLDDADRRSGAEQLGYRWKPIERMWRLDGSVLQGDAGTFELFGAIRLLAAKELIMIFEGGFVAIMATGSRDFTISKLDFAVTWLPPPDSSDQRKVSTPTGRRQCHSFQPEVYFNRDWHGSGNRFASEAEAEAFVAKLRATWIPQGFVKRDRVQIIREPPNAFLNWKTKQSEQMPEAGTGGTDESDEAAA